MPLVARKPIQVGDMLPHPLVWTGETEVIYTTGIYSKDAGFYNVMAHGKIHDEIDMEDDLTCLLDDNKERRMRGSSRTKAGFMMARIKSLVKAAPKNKMGELGYVSEPVESGLAIRIYAERKKV